MSVILSCWLQLRQKTKAKLNTKLTNHIYASDVIRVIHGVVKAKHQLGWMTTIMLHSIIYPTTQLIAQIWCTLSRFCTLLLVGHEHHGEWAGWGKMRKWDYIYPNEGYGSTCDWMLADNTVMWSADIICDSDDISSGGSQIEKHQSICMQRFVHRYDVLAVIKECMHFI